MLVLKTDTNPGTATFLPEGGGASGGSVIFRPGGVNDPGAGVYTAWADAHAAATAITGLKSIVIDNSIVSPAVIPAGTWDLSGIRLIGQTKLTGIPTALTGTLVNTAEDCIFLNFTGCEYMALVHTGAEPLVTSTAAPSTIIYLGPLGIISSTVAALWHVDTNDVIVYMSDDFAIADGGFEVFDIDLGSTLEIHVVSPDSVIVASDTLRGAGDADVFRNGMPSAIGAQANLTGALTVFQGDLPYTPAVLADWSGVDPGLVRTALDRIAAALGPIA